MRTLYVMGTRYGYDSSRKECWLEQNGFDCVFDPELETVDAISSTPESSSGVLLDLDGLSFTQYFRRFLRPSERAILEIVNGNVNDCFRKLKITDPLRPFHEGLLERHVSLVVIGTEHPQVVSGSYGFVEGYVFVRKPFVRAEFVRQLLAGFERAEDSFE